MKVLQVLPSFLPFQTAGTEVYTLALGKGLQKKGVEVKVVIPNYGKSSSADYQYDGLAVHQYPETSVVDRSLIMGYRSPEGLKHFSDFIKKEKPDIIHFHQISGSNGITLRHVQVCKTNAAKILMTFHLAGYSCKTGTLMYKGESLCDGVINLKKCSSCFLKYRGHSSMAPFIVSTSEILKNLSIDTSKYNHKLGTAFGIMPIIDRHKSDLYELVDACDQVVSISNWYTQVLLANGIDLKKITFIPQGLPIGNSPTSFRTKNPNKSLRILFLGRINPFKGLHLLIDAISEIDPELVELSIYGNSDDPVYESKLRLDTNQKFNIQWKGKLAQQNVLQTMQQHDILCLCSTFSEMSPLVIQEAFAVGLTVIASNVYGNAEQVQHGYNGLLFNFNDAYSLRNQIVECIKDRSLLKRISHNIKPPIDFKYVVNAYHQLYQNILAEK